MRSLVHDLARLWLILLFGASAWFGAVAGGRRWRPCLAGFDSGPCIEAQSDGTWLLPELLRPEGLSLLLLGLALLVLSLLGRMPVLVRLASLSAGAVYLLFAYDALSRLGEHDVGLPSQEGAGPGAVFLAFMAPVAMGVAGLHVLRRPSERLAATPGGVLSFVWFAMVASYFLAEYWLLSLAYASHDDPPGTGLLRSALTAASAGALLGSQVWVRSRSQRGREQRQGSGPEPPRHDGGGSSLVRRVGWS